MPENTNRVPYVAFDWHVPVANDDGRVTDDVVEWIMQVEPDPVWTERYTRIDIAEDEIAEGVVPTVAPVEWVPTRGDVVRIKATAGVSFRAGEMAIIDDVYNRGTGGNCQDLYCASCDNITVSLLRPTPPETREPHHLIYLYLCQGHMEPVGADEPGQWVRCDNTTSHHRGRFAYQNAHRYTPACVNAIISSAVDWDEVVNGLLIPDFEITWAAELEARNARRMELLGRLRTMAVGEQYMIDGPLCSFYGNVAQIRQLPTVAGDDNIICDILYPDGELRRAWFNVSAFNLGGRYSQLFAHRAVPSFIRFTTPRYSGTRVTMGDREIGDSADTHDCEELCFEYGCSARVSDYDEEPEFHAGDVPIHGYSYRPELTFSGDGPVYMGTELELSTGHGDEGERQQARAAKLLTTSDVGDLVYLKSDGSISGYGFEACFMPMSYDWLVENWPEDLLRSLRNAGALPHSSCGMHVHVNRDGFSDPVHAYKWIKFMYRNQEAVSLMARRDPSTWGSFHRPDERRAAKWHAKGGYGGYNRYTAINCMPQNTYEVRIFATTLNRTRYLGSLGLVDASVEYTRQITTEAILKQGAWKFAPFRDYVNSFAKYRPLQREMVRILDK